ncbi:MAG: hypothetical protein C4532_11765 [Candidatus Abyssobacteria bacterium SURF_17]|uniref:Uncharacterized protein n=1 Tax=Candidatus Abyssobacteria bacterium SURF_17 TaxID=2093361 RepID=A0A419EWH6_9BACT|nr:MAG: hypothetical protein C4532_11765 [Candidatus Abyssubacteria bacterium SURF_17]
MTRRRMRRPAPNYRPVQEGVAFTQETHNRFIIARERRVADPRVADPSDRSNVIGSTEDANRNCFAGACGPALAMTVRMFLPHITLTRAGSNARNDERSVHVRRKSKSEPPSG